MSAPLDSQVFVFGGFSLDPRQRLLFGPDGEPRLLSGRAFETLLYLVENPDRLIDKQTLMKAVWPNMVVEENNLNQNISIVRRVLGEMPGEHRFVVTVPGRGFRFVAAVNRQDGLAQADPKLKPELPESVGAPQARPAVKMSPPELHVTDHLTRVTEARRGPWALVLGAMSRAVRQVLGVARGRLPWLVAAIAVLVALSLAVPAVRYLREAPPRETRVDIVTPASDDPASFALSPDGRQIVFRAADEDGTQRLWLRSLSASSAQPLAGTEGAHYPFWSPDSRSVGFFAGGQLQRLDLGGGAPRTLAAAPDGLGGAWNADGVILFAASLGVPLSRISAAGGSAVAATKLAATQLLHAQPVFLPDGRHFVFGATGTSPETEGIYLAALDSTDVQRLTSTEGLRAYVPGWLLWIEDGGSLVAQRLDLARQRLIGLPVTIADGVGALSVSATGLVAYRTGTGRLRQLRWFDRAGRPQGVLGDPDETLVYSSVSPDGQRAVVARTVRGNQDLWLLDGTRTSRLTFDPANDVLPVWSPDGRAVAFSSTRSGSLELYRTTVDGAGTEELLVASPQPKASMDWSRDGRFLLYISLDPSAKNALWVRPMTGNQKPWVFLKSTFNEAGGQFSPDGRFVAFESDESGRNEIYIRPFAPPGEAANPARGQWQISTAGGIQPRWSPDGREVYYLDPQGRLMAASITVTGATVAPGAPVLLFATKIFGGGVESVQAFQYSVARDGRFLINTLLDESGSTAPIRLIQNWQPTGK